TDDTTTELSYENMKLKTKVVSTSAKGTKIKVIASNITGAENVKFSVEYSGDTTQRTTRTATLSAKGNWYKNILMSKFTSAGTYNVTCYIYTNTQKIKAGTTTFTITEENSGENTVTDISDTRGEATVSASNLAITFGTKKVKIAVWPYGDKSKIKWYTITSADDSGNYSALMNIYDFEKFYGTYKVRTYVYSNSGKRLKLADTTFTISEPTPTVSITSNSSYSEFYYSGTGFAGTGYTIKKLTVKVWSKEDGKDDITTYVATLGDDGETWTLTIPIEDHTGTGTYYAYTYAAYNDGTAKTRIKKSTFDFPLTEILGTSEKTAEDFVTYYNTYSPISYPDYYATSDAPTIEDFAQIYIEEALTEGVRADVAFAQAMKETGFLKYGGQVDISQYNFAGLGALDGGASGASFETVRLGIRAQIQHLKAYATDEALVNTCVDPRYTYVTKGCAKYVEWLGIKENPYGKGWASATNYGFSLVSGYLEKI
nr:GBS Bsp-like repeat-containing protein [Eubacterium sp.]